MNPTTLSTITLGAGCFWCVEAVFDALNGVHSVTSGYMGGRLDNPSYKAVCTGETGHAEVVQIAFDGEVIDLKQLLAIFFTVHDPTTLNRQGNDVGTQYRSVVFYHDDGQKAAAEEVIAFVTEQQLYADPIVTEISPASTFYAAEDYHHDYFANNRNQGYCRAVVAPKVAKFRKMYQDLLKEAS